MFYAVILTDTQTIFGYETKEEALEKFHTELSYAYNQHIACTGIVMDKHGAVYRSEEYVPSLEG